MPQHRVLVGELRLGDADGIAAQHEPLPRGHLGQPVRVPAGHVAERGEAAGPDPEQLEDRGRKASWEHHHAAQHGSPRN